MLAMLIIIVVFIIILILIIGHTDMCNFATYLSQHCLQKGVMGANVLNLSFFSLRISTPSPAIHRRGLKQISLSLTDLNLGLEDSNQACDATLAS